MRTTIRLNKRGEVVLRATDPITQEPVERTFFMRQVPGFIREDCGRFDRQVCAGLSHTGNTMWAKDTDSMLRQIRTQWQLYRRYAARQYPSVYRR